MLLVKFKNNYADEFDVKGWKLYPVLTEEEWNYTLSLIEKYWEELTEHSTRTTFTKRGVAYWFGTNEFISFPKFKEGYFNFLDSYEILKVKEEDVTVLLFLLGTVKGFPAKLNKFMPAYGVFADPIELLSNVTLTPEEIERIYQY